MGFIKTLLEGRGGVDMEGKNKRGGGECYKLPDPSAR